MPKNLTQFVCNECGYASPKWLGRCPDCGKFNTLVEEAVSPALTKNKAPMSANAHTFADMGATDIVIQNADMGMPDHQSCFFSDLSLTSS